MAQQYQSGMAFCLGAALGGLLVLILVPMHLHRTCEIKTEMSPSTGYVPWKAGNRSNTMLLRPRSHTKTEQFDGANSSGYSHPGCCSDNLSHRGRSFVIITRGPCA